MIRGKDLLEDDEFYTAVEMVVWINAQTARHKDSWVLYDVNTATTKGTKKPFWCGLVFKPA